LVARHPGEGEHADDHEGDAHGFRRHAAAAGGGEERDQTEHAEHQRDDRQHQDRHLGGHVAAVEHQHLRAVLGHHEPAALGEND
jgi:hypothetical protein